MAATITFLQLSKDASDLSTYTFSSTNFGTASSGRYLICVVSGRTQDGTSSGDLITSVTIGGVSATISVQAHNSGNAQGIAIAHVPTGTSGDVVVVFNETMTNADIAMYATTGVSSVTATDTATSTADPLSDTLNINAGGIAVGGAKSDSGSATATWLNLTETYDEGDANTNDISGAADAFASQQTGLSIQCTWSSSVRPVMVAASYASNTLQYQIADSNDDVFVDHTGGTIDFDGDGELIIGQHPSLPNEYEGGFRFTNIAIPQGSTIVSAYLTLTSQANSNGTPGFLIKGEDADDTSAFSTYANFVGRTRTTASVAWNPGAQTAEDVVDTSDISAVVQEIVNRGGWTSGNDMTFFIENNASNSWLLVYDYADSSVKSAKLTIEYTETPETNSGFFNFM